MSDGYGYMVQNDNGTESSSTAFQIDRHMAEVRGLIPVKVVKVYKIDGKSQKTQGAVEEAGFVDVQPLVSQVDGRGQKQDHTTIYHVPYTRIAGGNAAIIMDPVANDIGYIKVADRDISSFKDGVAGGSSAATYTPNSRRRHDLADSIYVGRVLSPKPAQYVTFGADGSVTVGDKGGSTIVLDGKGGITLNPANNGTVTVNGNLKATGAVVAGQGTGDQVGLQTHLHGGVTTGAGNTAAPNAGT